MDEGIAALQGSHPDTKKPRPALTVTGRCGKEQDGAGGDLSSRVGLSAAIPITAKTAQHQVRTAIAANRLGQLLRECGNR
ncbi:hypothetical protein D3C85_1592610 [compost metagenome]